MKLFFSGGGRPWLPELCLQKASVMLSYYVDTNKKGKGGARFRRLVKAKLRKRVKG